MISSPIAAVMAMSCASCGPHTSGRPCRQMSRVAVLPRARLVSRPHLTMPLACLMRHTNLQHSSTSTAAVKHGRAHMSCTSSVPRLALGSLFYSSADGLSAIVSESGASGSASNEPSATRRQLDQLFLTLWKEKRIATEQGCDCCVLSALEFEYDCGWIGYCFYTAEDAECLASKGYLKLTCGTYANKDEPTMPIIEVAQMVYDTALACNLPIQWDDIEYASLKIHGLDPEDFVDNTDDNIDVHSD